VARGAQACIDGVSINKDVSAIGLSSQKKYNEKSGGINFFKYRRRVFAKDIAREK